MRAFILSLLLIPSIALADNVWATLDSAGAINGFQRFAPADPSCCTVMPDTDPRMVTYLAWLDKGVPASVTRFQTFAALTNAGLYDQAQQAATTSSNPLVVLAWANAQNFNRNSPTIISIGASLGLSSSQIDDLFIAAAQIVE